VYVVAYVCWGLVTSFFFLFLLAVVYVTVMRFAFGVRRRLYAGRISRDVCAARVARFLPGGCTRAHAVYCAVRCASPGVHRTAAALLRRVR
jgi:hypothetical protein